DEDEIPEIIIISSNKVDQIPEIIELSNNKEVLFEKEQIAISRD
ncbi:9250_t:CDS:1, partial [Racocetra persica]